HAACRADESRLADGRVDHALPAVAFQQPRRHFEGASMDADVLANADHGRVALHLFKERLADALEQGGERHGYFLPRTGGAGFAVRLEAARAAGFAPSRRAPSPELRGGGAACAGFSGRAPSRASGWNSPRPATRHSAFTEERGGVTSATGRFHCGSMVSGPSQ